MKFNEKLDIKIIFPWGRFFSPVDTKGRESRTLFFISVGIGLSWLAIVVCTVKFILSDCVMSATDYATAIVTLGGLSVALIGAWLGREWITDKKDSTDRG